MSTRPTSAILQLLIERKPMALAKAEECDAKGQAGMALYWRIIAADAATLYAWITGDDGRYVLSEVERKDLLDAVHLVDDQINAYRVMVNRAIEAVT